MSPLPTEESRTRFGRLVAVTLIVAIAATAIAALTMLPGQPGIRTWPNAVLTPLSAQLAAAAVLSAQAAAVLYAPADKQGLLAPHESPAHR